MKTKWLVPTLFTLIIAIAGCKDEMLPDPEPVNSLKSSEAKIKIAVISDIHYMDHTLLPADPSSNQAFQNLLFNSYNKMVEFSEPIFERAVFKLKVEKPDVLLVTGDLANNGELLNHEIVKTKLQEIADAGTQVLVIPGNNDINSPDAKSYEGTGSTTVANITPADFVSMYGNFGYNNALYRDANSLSYIFQVRDDLWILGIDACRYGSSYSRGGEVKSGTMAWIQGKMTEASQNGITVLAMMHHGLAEHYTGQNKLISGDVVKNYSSVSTALSNAGIKFVFTGHSHANDIVEIAGNGNSIFDFETGSLITPLSSYRTVTIDDKFIKIDTKRINEIGTSLPGDVSFLSYSNAYLAEHLDLFFGWYLVNVFKLPGDLAQTALPYLRNAMMAQFAGDEKLLPAEAAKIEKLNELFPPDNTVIPIIKNFWTDLPPNDNIVHFKLK